ncbi:trypsin-like peptidase domain-containing protein [Halorubrum ejinorense]|uniref:Trypsin-like peptidase domain-containing protein n=1 Tax=Halorubrum ejinorense TaxID=425309 RepID=A0AAV3SQT7_9EURY
MDSVSRRRLLELASTGTVVGAAGCSDDSNGSRASTSPPSNSSEATKAELRNRISELRGEISALQEELSTKDERIEALEGRSGEHQYSEEVRQAATAAGRTLREAVVAFEFEYAGNYGSGGTGWFIDQNHVITNAHVVRDAVNGDTESATGYLLDGTEFDFSVTDVAEDDDVALVETETAAPYVPPRGTASSLTAGQPLVQVGHPSFIGNWVIGLGEYAKDGYGDSFNTEMPSTTGNSGSPVITLDGTVVGLTYAGTPREESSGPPTPSEEGALEEYPYQTSQYGLHVTIDAVEEYYERWTK